jgi:hypothetical protein
MLLWPAVAVLGFLAVALLVVGLGRGSTARYEYERNCVAAQRQQAVAVPGPTGPGPASGPVSAPAAEVPQPAAHAEGSSAPGLRLAERSAVGVAAHPAGKRIVDGAAPAWWLVDESGDEPGAWVVAGPFADRIEADWAVLANGLSTSTRAVHGVQRADGSIVRRQSPQERAWIAELDEQLDRLPEDWDELLSDSDALTTLVVEVGAALVDAGLPLHDGTEGAGQAGGVCLTPDLGLAGILVGWRQHDRMSLQQVRGASVDAAVQQTMNAAVADVLAQMGFEVESLGSGSGYLVTSATARPE